MKYFLKTPLLLLIGLLSCNGTAETEISNAKTLKAAFKNDFLIGAALNSSQIYGKDTASVALIIEQFNTITPENVFKPAPIHPEPNRYNFDPADKFVAFGEENDMYMVGHTLVWHSQVPDWIFVTENKDTVNRDILLQRMDDHISTIVGRYKGRVQSWDVVNEALNDDGSMRETLWLKIIGQDFIEKAFTLANEADPDAELYYNDYNLWKPAKRDGAVRIIKNLQEKGVKVDGVGMQGHYGIGYPDLEQIEESIIAFSDLGVKVMITELDIDLLPNPSKRQGADIAETFEAREGFNPYESGLPDSVQEKLSNRYKELFELFYKHRDKIDRVTFWGVADQHSWLNNWPMPGRTSYPLLFNRNFEPKPAYDSIIEIAR
ncbi:MAG: endo-1,4-beta-xylanase [Candidatus Cyclobacteriaceae bacterium M2_1C_046]